MFATGLRAFGANPPLDSSYLLCIDVTETRTKQIAKLSKKETDSVPDLIRVERERVFVAQEEFSEAAQLTRGLEEFRLKIRVRLFHIVLVKYLDALKLMCLH